ncbi:patatin-like phospholipase family protein [Nonomuraea rhodomycinica]|uniref:Patatin-like phospholipase family protein n=1 Tax=Nonomuraea rhodomycinica TaxID=1712872 RepID=A0A7Y6INZ0_9ACTN|nr:patatin-like phospholipase family protein [Nonomuraea rhodomycinica]NUW41473.1 patatin-like phospholipase family protein [Nonomuraea rhodomycinica]
MRAGTAVVLGPGGPVGTAWLAGLAAGLRREGVDLGAADLIVGTSAGAIVGAILAGGGDLERLAALPAPTGPGAGTRPDPQRLAEVFATLGDSGLARTEALRRVGRLALTASTGDEGAAIARMRSLVGAAEWPERPLLIPAVDAETGEAVVWDRHGSASLPEAVAASTAFPATAPPITVDGRRYIDGALRNGANLDLAADARVLIVAEPMAHLHPANGVAAGEGGTVVRLAPDAAAIEAFGPDLSDRTAWGPAYQAGVRQAPDAAEALRKHIV